MRRLDYKHYIGTTAAASASSPSQIDWKLANHLATHFSESCLGFHVISPALMPPKFRDSPTGWARWKAASITNRPVFGYSAEDLSTLQRIKPRKVRWLKPPDVEPLDFDLNGFREPNTLSYGLCDSPVGLLLFVLMLLRVMGPTKKLSPKEIVTLTELTWIPGPEATLRFWAACADAQTSEEEKQAGRNPKISITVFNGDGEELNEELKVSPRPAKQYYASPKWADHKYDVISTNRVSGRPGLLAWERPEVIVEGARRLAKGILAADKRMQVSELPGAALLEQVTLLGAPGPAPAEISGTTMHGSAAESSISPLKGPASPMRIPGSEATTNPTKPVTRVTPISPDLESPDRDMASPDSGEQSQGGSSPSTVIALNPQK